jgi:hypothetical protein
MIQYFKNMESEYLQWLELHPLGYVFNHFGGSTAQAKYNKIHYSDCVYLRREQDDGVKKYALLTLRNFNGK